MHAACVSLGTGLAEKTLILYNCILILIRPNQVNFLFLITSLIDFITKTFN
jgi:hypothetical protein